LLEVREKSALTALRWKPLTSDNGAPLGQLELKDADYGWITSELKKIAGSA
jgi:hypothetical protein